MVSMQWFVYLGLSLAYALAFACYNDETRFKIKIQIGKKQHYIMQRSNRDELPKDKIGKIHYDSFYSLIASKEVIVSYRS